MQQVYTQTGLSGLEERMRISVTRVTLTDSEWENDKWPIFAYVRFYDSVTRDICQIRQWWKGNWLKMCTFLSRLVIKPTRCTNFSNLFLE